MGLHFELDQNRHLRIVVSGDFNCEVSRAILQCVKAHRLVRSTPVYANLAGVQHSSHCAVTLLVLLVELLVGDFHIESCSAELEALYADALMAGVVMSSAFDKSGNCLTCAGRENHCCDQ